MEIESYHTWKIFAAERIPQHKEVIYKLEGIIAENIEASKYFRIEEIPRMDNKPKDYLEHSQKNSH